MIIECEEDPEKLIEQIGDPFFLICDETVDKIYRHPHHPNSIRITDAEFGITIDINTEYGLVETFATAKALCKLLNQEYGKVK